MKPPRCPSAIRRRTWADSRLLGAAPGAAIGLAPEARALAGRLGGGLGLAPVLVGPVGLVGLLGLFQLLTCLLDLARRAIKPRGNVEFCVLHHTNAVLDMPLAQIAQRGIAQRCRCSLACQRDRKSTR